MLWRRVLPQLLAPYCCAARHRCNARRQGAREKSSTRLRWQRRMCVQGNNRRRNPFSRASKVMTCSYWHSGWYTTARICVFRKCLSQCLCRRPPLPPDRKAYII